MGELVKITYQMKSTTAKNTIVQNFLVNELGTPPMLYCPKLLTIHNPANSVTLNIRKQITKNPKIAILTPVLNKKLIQSCYF